MSYRLALELHSTDKVVYTKNMVFCNGIGGITLIVGSNTWEAIWESKNNKLIISNYNVDYYIDSLSNIIEKYLSIAKFRDTNNFIDSIIVNINDNIDIVCSSNGTTLVIDKIMELRCKPDIEYFIEVLNDIKKEAITIQSKILDEFNSFLNNVL